ncbi:MAG: hypothetical protein RR922_00710 [Clostridia bacterium]
MEFTQEELQNVRHLIGASCTLSKKVNYYSTCINDQNATELLSKIEKAAKDNETYLCGKL